MCVLENAIVRLLREKPFYGYFLLEFRRRKVMGNEPVGATLRDGVPVLCVDPESFETFRPEQRQALLEHVPKHILHLHPARRKGRHSRDWNLACDLAINPDIENLPSGAALPERLHLEGG
jgi:predicted metal-dependent peptidase